ncbi:glycosyltransferase [Bacillus sp. FJAT-45037]|uniref:glycosyltransferase n=1 Tax=Bacillus sp. FJAT-45037 TaxID=2011007 RepID=UPI000C242279|nr:glycosyltransferase family 2 protein [Bacillus sp. FJAT-45037]
MISWIVTFLLTLLLFWNIKKKSQVAHSAVKSLSIIIPARNEENNLPRLLHSINRQLTNKQIEIIVVNDHSTDETKQRAIQLGATVIDAPPLPENWLGKPWACWNGATIARGSHFLFIDADTWFDDEGLDKLIRVSHADVLTVHPYHKMKTFYEKLSSIFHLIVYASTGSTHLLSPFCSIQGGFGQCMLIKKESYFKLDGHRLVKRDIVEHYSFVQHAAKSGLQIEAMSGEMMVSMRMYKGNLRAVINGWSKSFASGAKMTNKLLTIIVALWITLLTSTILEQMMNRNNIVMSLSLYAILCFILYRILKRIGNFTFFDVLLLPIHLLFFLFVFAYSVVTTTTKTANWKGRTIVIKEEKS